MLHAHVRLDGPADVIDLHAYRMLNYVPVADVRSTVTIVHYQNRPRADGARAYAGIVVDAQKGDWILALYPLIRCPFVDQLDVITSVVTIKL